MNRFKGLFNLYNCIPSENIDPFNFIKEDGPWLIGSFVLWNYLQKPNWKYNDLDYVVRTDEQANHLINYFEKICLSKTQPYDNIFKYQCEDYLVQINCNKYDDIRLRLHQADLSHTKIAHNGNEFFIDKIAQASLNKNDFYYTGQTFDIERTNKRITLYKQRGFNFLDKYSL